MLGDENREIFREKVKLGKFSTKSEKFLGNRGIMKQGEMHHCLRGMDAPEQTYLIQKFSVKNRLFSQRPLSKTEFFFSIINYKSIYWIAHYILLKAWWFPFCRTILLIVCIYFIT